MLGRKRESRTSAGRSDPTLSMSSFYGSEPIGDVVCPLCLATSGRILYRVTPGESAKVFIRPTINPEGYRELESVIGALWGGGECRQVRCDVCESVYAWPHRAGDARFYNLAFREHMRYPQNRWEFAAAAQFVARDAKGPMLELGAGDGAFVRTLRSAGVPAGAIHAVEYADAPREQIAAIDPALSAFSSLEQFLERAGPNACSHVFAFQVLEHVQQPVEYLETFRGLLQAGGLVCMAVPNPGHIETNEQSGLLLDMPPNHVTRFTVKGISALAERAGFEVVHSEVEPFVYRDWLREFLSYHFKRRVQNEGSVQHWIERKLPWRLATMAGAVLAMPSALLHSMKPNEGGSLFCVLRARG